MSKGERYSVTLYTPGKLERLTAQDWDNLANAGFPIYLYELLPAKMRRLTTPSHVRSLTPGAEKIQETLASGRADQSQTHHRSYDALISHFLQNDEMGLTLNRRLGRSPQPKGQFALYDAKRGEVVKSDRWRPPDFRSLIKVAQTD